MPKIGDNLELVINQILDSLKRLVEVAHDGALVGIKRRLNFIGGDNVTLDISDNPKGNSVDITINSIASGGGGGVPTTRLIGTTSPILGGGDLSVDRTISFDSSALLANNARVAVGNNGSLVGTRRRINFIPGSAISYTITDDAPNEEVDITIAYSGISLSDGDKGDITVSGSGSTFTIDNAAVTYAKIQNVTADRVLGRVTIAGPPQELTVTSPISFSGSSIAFDGSDLVNNARVEVRKAGAPIGKRRAINFIAGTNITINTTDDGVNEEVEVEIVASGGGGGGGLTHPQVISRAFLC